MDSSGPQQIDTMMAGLIDSADGATSSPDGSQGGAAGSGAKLEKGTRQAARQTTLGQASTSKLEPCWFLPLAALAGIAAAVVCSASAANAANARAPFAPVRRRQAPSVATCVSGQPVIQRFPFVNGLPATTPDLTFDNLTNPMAVGVTERFMGPSR